MAEVRTRVLTQLVDYIKATDYQLLTLTPILKLYDVSGMDKRYIDYTKTEYYFDFIYNKVYIRLKSIDGTNDWIINYPIFTDIHKCIIDEHSIATNYSLSFSRDNVVTLKTLPKPIIKILL